MKLRTIIATAATAAVLASSGVAIAGAASSTDSHAAPAAPAAQTAAATSSPAAATPAVATPSVAPRVNIRRRLRIRALLRGAAGVVTTAINIDRKTLRQGLRSGMTVAQIATAHNVSPQTVIDALVAAANKKIDAAVQAGKITTVRGARIEQRLPARIAKLVNNWHPKRFRTHAVA